MVHPSELLRTNSADGRQFSAPANILAGNTIDCGIAALPCINRLVNLERFAKPNAFAAVLALLGLLQGVALTYFRQTAEIWGRHYSIPPAVVDWLIYTNEFLVGMLALAVAYWGNRIHRISWIGGLAVLLSITCLVLTVPESYRPNFQNHLPSSVAEANLCVANKTSSSSAKPNDIHHLGFALLAVFQIFYAMTTISFTCHGITYLDDNISPKQAPGYIGIVLAGREIGKQGGIYLSWMPFLIQESNIFVSFAWISVSILIFVVGTIIAMFPRALPSVLLKRAAASILDVAAGQEVCKFDESADGFVTTLMRLVKNRILLINIASIMFMETALVNFGIYEKYFYQTRFHIWQQTDSSTYYDPPLVQFTTNLLKQPLVAISLITTGMVVAKVKPKARTLVIWNVVILILVVLLFGSGAFVQCNNNLETEYKDIQTKSYCNDHCVCNFAFQPICIKEKTYYSPCLAGCTTFKEIGSNYKIYQNCTCGEEWYQKNNYEAIEGACNAQKCNLLWGLSQVNLVFLSALLATTLVNNLIINMRCIAKKDKAAALGLAATFVGIIPYLPVKSIYAIIASKYCRFYGIDSCQLYSEQFANFLSIITVVLMAISAILAAILLLFIKNLELYRPLKKGNDTAMEIDDNLEERNSLMADSQRKKDLSEEHLDLSLQEIVNNKRASAAASGVSTATPDSLQELENVGDDHDSVDSIRSMPISQHCETEF